MGEIVLGDKVVLYGFFDGFSYETDGTTNVIFMLENGERVELPIGYFIKADKIVKKDEINLKDVIKRIKGFDDESKKAWLNKILNELGSDYGLMKYKEGYKQGKLEGAFECEKEKRYSVEVKGVSGYGRYLNKALSSGEYFFASENELDLYKTKHTRKELENSGFGWVFDCPGVEVKEVVG